MTTILFQVAKFGLRMHTFYDRSHFLTHQMALNLWRNYFIAIKTTVSIINDQSTVS
jgi:hypothetical protein